MHVFLPDLRLNARLHGPEGAPALVLSHALGTDLTIWDDLLPLLPGLRILTYDHRGHGASDVPKGPYAMGAMIRDAERLMEHFALKDAVFLGVSLGGLVAQGLAIKRLDLVRALVLSNTAARIGAPSLWQARAEEVRTQGLAAYAPGALQRQLGPKWRDHPARDRLETLLTGTSTEGWCAAAQAIAGADFTLTTPTLRLPTLVIAGTNDGTTPPDLVRETAEMIPGARFTLLRGTGHLPMVENPKAYAETLRTFLQEIGH
ncbi:3-oxoadipate enol-lactonase [Stagnihabitans tardus]|uniref:3-oxoadipate enol-lactonase n=1 Tax=Stagnihabitans tardus TaxID=2699202 RepID=A0AAE4Y985_9RHOB|nr:3-oxoadipate enol-lactonase [Stagnihabitans tardus]NBZ88363.1 3-oxoadipate enol-lactonase [Stagnihabitans tardus]